MTSARSIYGVIPKDKYDDLFVYVSRSLLESGKRELFLDVPKNGLLSQLDVKFTEKGFRSNTLRLSMGNNMTYEDNRAVYLLVSPCDVTDLSGTHNEKMGTLIFLSKRELLNFKTIHNVIYLITFYIDYNLEAGNSKLDDTMDKVLRRKLRNCSVINKSYDYWETFVNQGPFDDPECYRYLLNKAPTENVRRSMLSYNDNIALRTAASQGYLETVMYLHSIGADIDSSGFYALRKAIYNGHLPVVMYLVSTSETPLKTVNIMSGQPLRIAVKQGHYYIAMYLIRMGANPEEVTSDDLAEARKLQEYRLIDMLNSSQTPSQSSRQK